MTMIHATLAPGARLELPWRTDFNALVYVMSGRGVVGASDTPISAGRLAVLGAGDAISLGALASADGQGQRGLEVVILGGQPIREPIAWAGPFVMNTKA
jgi:redox-sensitive bicupin YhaK (pirin superfamily)